MDPFPPRTTRSGRRPMQVMPVHQETFEEDTGGKHSKRSRKNKSSKTPSVDKRSSLVAEISDNNPGAVIHIPFFCFGQPGPLVSHILVQDVSEEQLRQPMSQFTRLFANTIEQYYQKQVVVNREFVLFKPNHCITGGDLTSNKPHQLRTTLKDNFTQIPLSTILASLVQDAENWKATDSFDDVIVLGIDVPMKTMVNKDTDCLSIGSPWTCYQRLVQTKGPAPSSAAKSSTYATLQSSPTTAIHDGRRAPHHEYQTVAPPIYHYHPIFSDFFQFIAEARQEMTKEHLRKTQKFMATAAFIVPSETKRMPAVWRCLDEIIGTTIHSEKNLDETASDAMEFEIVDGVRIPILIGEGKRENGEGGSDASTQAGCSTKRAWIQSDKTMIRDRTNCPTFILAAGGPWFCIMGGVITNQVIVQRLTAMEWLVCSSTAEDHRVYKMACVLWALRKALQKLKAFYKSLEPVLRSPMDRPPLNDTSPRFYPSPTTFLVEGHRITFAYKLPLESGSTCVTYKAEIVDIPTECRGLSLKVGDSVVIKFVTRYGEAGHRYLAQCGFAPALYYVGEVPDWKGTIKALRSEPKFPGLDFGSSLMVVMEFIQACEATYERCEGLALQVAKILSEMHGAGFVFGDLRPPNMLYNGKQVMLVDFNWMGRFDTRNLDLTGIPLLVREKIMSKKMEVVEGEEFATFPLNVNTEVFGEENLGLEPIHPRHDWKMWSLTFRLEPTLADEILESLL